MALELGTRWQLAVRLRGGSLTARTAGALDRDIGEIGVAAGARATSWLTFRAGATRRIHATALARQRWFLLDLGGEANVPLAVGGGAMRAIVRGALLPVVAVPGLDAPTTAFAAATGMEYLSSGATKLTILYSLERTDFPARRREQLSAVTARVTIRFGAGRRPQVRGRVVP